MPHRAPVERAVKWIAAVVGILTAILIPALYSATAYQYEESFSQREVDLVAQETSSFVYANPDTWQFLFYRLEEKLTRQTGGLGPGQWMRIVDAAGKTVIRLGDMPSAPVITVSSAVSDGFKDVGRVDYVHNIRHVWIGGLLAAIVGIALGGLGFVALRVLPLRALSKALTALEREIEHRRQVELALRENERMLRQMAHFDGLTGLPNRTLGKDRLVGALARAHRDKTMVAVMFVDLDGFKSVNDDFGHEAGDRVLKEVAQRLGGCVRETDTVSRVGGDEFTIIVTDVKESESLRKIAENVLAALAVPFSLEGESRRLGASIGIAFYPDDGESPDTLVKAADATMYAVKVAGKGGYAFAAETPAVAPVELGAA